MARTRGNRFVDLCRPPSGTNRCSFHPVQGALRRADLLHARRRRVRAAERRGGQRARGARGQGGGAAYAQAGLVRREPAVAESALERLGDLLRYSLRIQRESIDEAPLREECAFVENYLALERLRLADRLRVSVDTPPATLECLVPTFAVQILVENAIQHAIAPRASGGLLQICVRRVD